MANSNTNSFIERFMCMCVLTACMYAYHAHARCPRRSNRVLGLLDLEFMMVVSHLVTVRKQRAVSAPRG